MFNKLDLLKKATFGSRIAEDEIDELHSYFVETEDWRKVISGEVDIVFGSKGSGKSALYSLLVLKKEDLRLGRRTVFIAAENPRGTPVFRDLVTEPPISEENFKALWKLYFLTITANYVRRALDVNKISNINASLVIDFLTKNELLEPDVTLLGRLKNALSYIRKFFPTIEGTIKDPVTGIEVTGKLTLTEPTPEQRKLGWQSLDDLLLKLNKALQEMNITLWLVLDRLDVAFTDSGELESNAIRSLFKTYLDMLSLSQIKLKVFLRDDIWKKVVIGGFREASHITRSINLTWDKQSLLNIIVRRLLSNEDINSFYKVNKDEVLSNISLQEELFYRVFPKQVDVGKRKPPTFEWMLSRTADGTKRIAPRELIHLLIASRNEQLKLYQIGNPGPGNDNLFDKSAIRSALPYVSKARYEQTLCAEHPVLKKYLEKMERGKTQQTNITLAKIWKCPKEEASEIAEKLVEVGFFERRGDRDSPSYWVPLLYRDALDLVQGTA
jgi:hypothetical protein